MASPTSGFWNAGPGGSGDGPIGGYTRQNWNDLFRKLFTRQTANEGVLTGVDGELFVTGAATPLTVAAGAAIVYGWWFVDPTSTSVAISTPAATAGGRINLRADWAAQTVRIVAVQAASGVITPPALVQIAGTTWDIPLATYTVTNTGVITVTDARQANHMATRVSTAMLDDDAVDDTKVGNRVPALIRREGGSTTDWSSPGPTSHTPGAVRQQVGAISATVTGGSATTSVAVTFPVAFSQIPLIYLSLQDFPASDVWVVKPASVSVSGFTVSGIRTTTAGGYTLNTNWLAIGAE